MRISCVEGDIGFAPKSITNRAHVKLDDEHIEGCFTADEERGEALCFVFDSRGRMVIDGDAILTERYTGKVEILLEAEPGHG